MVTTLESFHDTCAEVVVTIADLSTWCMCMYMYYVFLILGDELRSGQVYYRGYCGPRRNLDCIIYVSTHKQSYTSLPHNVSILFYRQYTGFVPTGILMYPSFKQHVYLTKSVRIHCL